MKKILLIVAIGIVLFFGIRMFVSPEEKIDIKQMQTEECKSDIAALTKDLTAFWTEFIKSHQVINLSDVNKADSEADGIVEKSALYQKSRKVSDYIAWAVKLRCLKNVSMEKMTDPKGIFVFLDKYNLKNPCISLTTDPLNLAFAYINTVEKLTKNHPYVKDYSDRVKMILEIPDPSLVSACLKIDFGFAQRYNGYERWMTDLMPEIEKKADNKKLVNEIKAFAETFHYLIEGGKAPDFELADAQGNLVKLSDFKGKVLVIDVWGTWCGGCIRALPKLIALRDKYKNNKDVVFMTIAFESYNTYERWKSDIVKYNISDMVSLFSCADEANGEAFQEAYNLMGAPRYFIVDREGIFRLVYNPYTDEKEFEEILKNTLNQ